MMSIFQWSGVGTNIIEPGYTFIRKMRLSEKAREALRTLNSRHKKSRS